MSAFIRHFEQRKELTGCAASLDLASIYCARAPVYREALFSVYGSRLSAIELC